jgi:probable rRNA maturation factor
MDYDIDIQLEDGVTADLESVRALCERVCDDQGVEEGAGLTVLFAGDARLHLLNREHRHVDAPTDVLSFPANEELDEFPGFEAVDEEYARYLGDIAISVETATRQAAEAHLPLEVELSHLVLHGLLHILGHDHETPEDDRAMRSIEEAYLGPGIHASGAHADD